MMTRQKNDDQIRPGNLGLSNKAPKPAEANVPGLWTENLLSFLTALWEREIQ